MISPPENVGSARRAFNSDAWAMGLTALWLVAIRSALGVGWGWETLPPGGDLSPGVLFNAGDTWSYLSWVNQYAEGRGAAELIYTTESHPGLLWVFPLWLIGMITKLTGLPALLVYNISGVFGAVAAVFAFRRVTRLLVPAGSACDWATMFFVIGSGGSWIWHLVHRSTGLPSVPGGEFYYLDFLPSTTFLAYPYHAISCALLASLWWSVTVCEQRFIPGRSAKLPLGVMVVGAGLLAFSRPYEPLAFLAAYGLKTALAWKLRRVDPAVWQSSFRTLTILGVAVAPGVLWTVYVATQPIWSTFATVSLALGLPRTGWLTALGVLWLTAAVGGARLCRLPHLRGALPLCATALSVILLLGLGRSGVKLSSGLPLGIAIAAGTGIAALMKRIQHARLHSVARLAGGVALAAVVLGTPSYHLGLMAMRLNQTAPIEAGLAALVERIPLQTNGRLTVVLTDTNTGLILPGWKGLRVYAGHFSLTHDFKSKQAHIRAAGLDPEHLPESAEHMREKLLQLIEQSRADFVLIDTRCEQARKILATQRGEIWGNNNRWMIWRPAHG